MPPRPAVPAPRMQPAMAAPGYGYSAPMYVAASGSGAAARATNALMMVLVIACAVIAAAAGYFLARQQAPTDVEMLRYQQLAAAQGYQAGRTNGIGQGRSYAYQSNRRIAQLKAAIARQKQWNRGYRNGKAAGLRSRRRSYGGYSHGYSTPRYRSYRGGSTYSQTSQALGAAQNWANITGAPVDVEIY